VGTGVATRLTEASAFAHLWTTPALTELFDEPRRLQRWLDILAALASAQADLGLIPGPAAAQIAGLRADALDLDLIAEQTRRTGHSTLGLIAGLQAVLEEEGREYVYYGATVQDLTDTWFGTVMRDVAAIVRADLVRLRAGLLRLTRTHRATPMLGRTHGQPGAPITFGLKTATWADEVGRHLRRLDEATPRWAVGQLAGAVGALGFFGSSGVQLRQAFCARLGLADPGVSWTATRDRVGEFGSVLALVSTTLARIGNEVVELQRPEIGEVAEPAPEGVVGSITMPHKRNPELSEHLDTLARLVRANAAVLVEGMAGMHERDGRAWKAEWVALPEVALCAAAAAALAVRLVDGLQVDPERMRANLDGAGRGWASEQALVALSARLGKHRAQAVLHDELRRDGEAGRLEVFSREADELTEDHPALRSAVAMADAVAVAGEPLARCRPRRRLALLPTPVHRLSALESVLGRGPIHLKRDDLTGFALAGNKSRALEYLLGDAQARGADIVVTAGAPGSNFIGAAAVAARVSGLECLLLIAGTAPERLPVTLELARRCGAELRFTEVGREQLDALVTAEAEIQRGHGRRPYPIPRGGATAVGALGFAVAAGELAAQLDQEGLADPLIIVPTGSGASIAGLSAGAAALGRRWRLRGVCVSRPVEAMHELVAALAADCAQLLVGPAPEAAGVQLVDAVGAGFGTLTARDVRAVQLALHTEGVLLDATYGAKAVAVLVTAIEAGEAGPYLLWHTGGLPSALKLLADPGLSW
jgi:adenylosuccinate lyase